MIRGGRHWTLITAFKPCHGTWRSSKDRANGFGPFEEVSRTKICGVTSLEWTSFLTRLTGGGVRRCNDERAETRIVNKLVDSLTTFRRFSAPRTLSELQEHLIKLIILVSYMIYDFSTSENSPNNGERLLYCSRMIDCMIDSMIECMIDILTVFCRLLW